MHWNHESTRVILLRHGRSTYNELGLVQGSSDNSVLTALGEEEAAQAGLILGSLDISTIYCSPLQRAQQTVAHLQAAAAAPIPVVIDPDLREIDLPAWHGHSLQWVRENHADDYRCWQDQPQHFQMQVNSSVSSATVSSGSRSSGFLSQEHDPLFPVLDLYQRAAQFWTQLLPYHRGQTILVVSHAGTIRALISTAIGLDPSYYHQLQQSNGGLSLLEFNPLQPVAAELQVMNSTAHLGQKLPKLKEGKQGLRLLLLPNCISQIQTYLIQIALQTIELDFSLINLSENSPVESLSFRSKHILSMDSLTPAKDWQALINRYWSLAVVGNTPHDRPLTGLIMASPEILQTLLRNTSFSSFEEDVPITGLTVLHFPASDRRSILQALNLFSSSAIQFFS